MKYLAALTLILFTFSAHAKVFRNAYVSFELPPNWNCKLESTEWVCLSQYSKKSKEAIIILTAKEVGPSDNFQTYQTYLKTPKTIPNKQGKPQKSKVLHSRSTKINDQLWVEGMHLGSEVATYYTRYLATIKDRLAILVTFSAHKQHYTKYTSDFMKSIKSLRVVASKNILADTPNNNIRPGSSEPLGSPIGDVMMGEMDEEYPEEEGANNELITQLLGLALILGAAGFYLYRRKS